MSSQGSYDGKGPGRSGIYEGGVSEEQERDDSFGDDDSEEQESDDTVGDDDSEEQVSDGSIRDDDSEEQVYNGGQGSGRSGMYEGGVFEDQLSDESFLDDDSEETEKAGSQESGVSAAESSHSQQPLNIGEQAEASDETEAELADNTAADKKLSPMRIVKIDTEPFIKGKTIDEMNHLSIADDIIRTIVGKNPKTATEPWAEASETISTSDIGASASQESSCSSSIVDKLVYQELHLKREIHKRLFDENVDNPFTEHFRLKLFNVKRPERSTTTKLFNKLLTDESREKLKKENEMTLSYLLFFYRNIETKSDTSKEKVIKPEMFTLCTGYLTKQVLKYADKNFSKAVERRTLQFPFQHVAVTKDSGPIKKERKFARPGREILFSVWDCLDNIVGNRTRKLKEHSSLYSSSLKRVFLSKTGKKCATSIDITEKGMKIRRSLTIPQVGLVLNHFSKICLNKPTFLEGEPGNMDEEVDDPNFKMHDFYCKIEDSNLRAELDCALQGVLQNGMKGKPTNLYLEHRDYEKWIKSEEICLYARKFINRDTGATKRKRRDKIETWHQPPSLDELLKRLQKYYCGTDFQTDWLDDVLIKFSNKTCPLKEFIYTRLSLGKTGTYLYHYGTWLQMSAHYLYLIEKDFVQKMTGHLIEASKLHLLPWKNISKEETEENNNKNIKRTTKNDNKEKVKQKKVNTCRIDLFLKKNTTNVATSSTKEAEANTNVATSSTKEAEAKTNVATPYTKKSEAKTNVATSFTKEAKAKTNVATSSTKEKKNVATSPAKEKKARTDVATSPAKEKKARTDVATPPAKEKTARPDIATSPAKEKKARTDVGISPAKEKKARTEFGISPAKETKARADVGTSPAKEKKARTDVATSPAKEKKAKTDAATFLTNQAKANPNVATSPSDKAKAKTNVALASTKETKTKAGVASSLMKDIKPITSLGTFPIDYFFTKTKEKNGKISFTEEKKDKKDKKEKVNTYRFTFEKFDKENEREKWKTHFDSLHNRETFENVQSEIDTLASAECLTVSCELENTATAKVAAHLYLLHECILNESGYNKSHALLNRLLTDTGIKMVTCDTKTSHTIEICDILIWDDNTTYFVHVKLGFEGGPIREVCSQIRNSADHIYREQTISAGTGIIKKYWEVLTTPSLREFHQEETKRVLETMGKDKFMELFHSKRDIVFVLACRDVRVKGNFGYEHNLSRDLDVNMADKIKADFIQKGDVVIDKLKREGYLTEKGCLTDKFILDGKMSEGKFKEETEGWPEIGSKEAANKLLKILTQNLSESRSTIAKMEIIRLVQDFERYNVGDKQFQLKICSIDHQFAIQNN